MTAETSVFTGEGFTPFPNVHADNENVGAFSELSDEGLERKVNEYGQFIQRKDLMPRAVTLGHRVLDHLLFELAYREGIYDE